MKARDEPSIGSPRYETNWYKFISELKTIHILLLDQLVRIYLNLLIILYVLLS